jgi:hypothetical protein
MKMLIMDKKIGARYVSQALEILGKIPIEDSPNGDGSPRKGRIMRLDAIKYYLQIAQCQYELPEGQKATDATFSRLIGMVRTQPQAETVVDFCLIMGQTYRAVGLLKKFDTDGLLAVKFLEGRDNFDDETKAFCRAGIEKTKNITDNLEGFMRLLDFIEVLNHGNGDGAEARETEISALFRRAKELIPKFTNIDKLGEALALCRAVSLGLEIEAIQTEAKLRAAAEKKYAYLALGLYWLGRQEEAEAMLKKLTPKDPAMSIPAALVTVASEEAFIALATRMKNTMVLVDAANNTQYEQSTEVRLAFLDAAERIAPVALRYYAPFLMDLYEPLDAEHKTKWQMKLKKEINSKDTAPSASEIVRIAAWVDPTIAQKYLPRITDPESRVDALVCLAHAELVSVERALA